MNVNIQFADMSITGGIRVHKVGKKVVEVVIPCRAGNFVDKKSAEEARQIAVCKNWDEVIWVIRTLNKMRRFEYIQEQ